MKKFLLLISLLCLFSVIYNLRASSSTFLNLADDELDLDDSKFNSYENESNNELEKEDNYDKIQDNESKDLNTDAEFDEKALKDEIHHDIGSEKVSYKFDD